LTLATRRNRCTLGCVQSASKETTVAKRTAKTARQELPIGERLRHQRVEVLKKSIREVARLLDSAPIHVSDIENAKRSPSEELLIKIAAVYGLPEAELRSGFARPDAVVAEVASESTVAAEKVPEFLRTARGLSAQQWDQLIKQAKKIQQQGEGGQ
jgi:transcriptional regulator with XRE-family HTH domain